MPACFAPRAVSRNCCAVTGTVCGHFSEQIFGNELSTGMINTVSSYIETLNSRHGLPDGRVGAHTPPIVPRVVQGFQALLPSRIRLESCYGRGLIV